MTDIPDLTGRHRAVCRSAQFGTTKKGDEQIAIGFELLDADGQPTGTTLTYFGVFGDKSIDFTIEAIRNCGWAGEDLAELPGLADAGQLGAEVSLVVALEEYDGKWSNKVKWVNRPGGGKVKLERPLDERGLKDFAQRMKSKVRAAGRDAGERRQPAQQRAAQPHPNAPGNGDDEIPF